MWSIGGAPGPDPDMDITAPCWQIVLDEARDSFRVRVLRRRGPSSSGLVAAERSA
jgi:hypothetical protein